MSFQDPIVSMINMIQACTNIGLTSFSDWRRAVRKVTGWGANLLAASHTRWYSSSFTLSVRPAHLTIHVTTVIMLNDKTLTMIKKRIKKKQKNTVTDQNSWKVVKINTTLQGMSINSFHNFDVEHICVSFYSLLFHEENIWRKECLYMVLRFYEYNFVDLEKQGVFPLVGEIPCYRNDCYYYH